MSRLGQFPNTRLRRLRQHKVIRQLIRETQLTVYDLILPLFIRAGSGIKKGIKSMPGHYQLSIDMLDDEIHALVSLGIQSIILFGIPSQKNSCGIEAYQADGVIQQALAKIKTLAPHLLVITDVCLCEYTDHGHCGIVSHKHSEPQLDNDQTLDYLAKQAISHAKAGADVIAPSGMIDGMVQAIRRALDEADFKHIPILSYSVKYASSLYGPFREAAEGAPTFGDRRTHQMDVANTTEALRECELDIAEGADMLMVKPAHAYLDIITRVKEAYPSLPLGAYHTSGEYVMLKAAAEKGWLDERAATLEVLTAIKRAGANFIITYCAKEVAKWLQEPAVYAES